MTEYFEWFGEPGGFVLTLLLSLAALISALIFRTRDRVLCFFAVALSSVGDIFLMNYKNIGSRLEIDVFIPGLLAFAAAHILYVFAFYSIIKHKKKKLRNVGFDVGADITLVLIAVMAVLYYLSDARPALYMFILCAVYLALLGANLAVVWSAAFSLKGIRILAAVGILSFYLSDIINGLGRLSIYQSSALGGLIWWLYPIGQILIIIGV